MTIPSKSKYIKISWNINIAMDLFSGTDIRLLNNKLAIYLNDLHSGVWSLFSKKIKETEKRINEKIEKKAIAVTGSLMIGHYKAYISENYCDYSFNTKKYWNNIKYVHEMFIVFFASIYFRKQVNWTVSNINGFGQHFFFLFISNYFQICEYKTNQTSPSGKKI